MSAPASNKRAEGKGSSARAGEGTSQSISAGGCESGGKDGVVTSGGEVATNTLHRHRLLGETARLENASQG
jgi:hypothetical protein